MIDLVVTVLAVIIGLVIVLKSIAKKASLSETGSSAPLPPVYVIDKLHRSLSAVTTTTMTLNRRSPEPERPRPISPFGSRNVSVNSASSMPGLSRQSSSGSSGLSTMMMMC